MLVKGKGGGGEARNPHGWRCRRDISAWLGRLSLLAGWLLREVKARKEVGEKKDLDTAFGNVFLLHLSGYHAFVFIHLLLYPSSLSTPTRSVFPTYIHTIYIQNDSPTHTLRFSTKRREEARGLVETKKEKKPPSGEWARQVNK